MMFARRFQHLCEIERKRIIMPDGLRMRLNRLERVEPWPEALQHAIANSAALGTLQQYPAYQAFYERLAAFNGLRPDQIVVGAGIEEFIRSLFMLCIEPGDKVAFFWPTCAMFEIYARVFGAEIVRIAVDPGDWLSLDQFIGQLPQDLKLLILVNPGQPIDTYVTPDAVHVIADVCRQRGAILAVDEAYHGFGAPTSIAANVEHENIVVLRSFSKAFGAASIRLGWATGSPEMVAALDAVRQSGEVSTFSMHVATVLMDNYPNLVGPEIAAICMGRDRLRHRIEAELGLKARGRWANHVLIEHEDAAAIANRLAARGILVRAGMPAPLDRHILVSCGGPELMDEFFDELKAAL